MKIPSNSLLLVAAVILLQACNNSNGKDATSLPASEKIPVRVLDLKKSQVQEEIQASGQFFTDDETYLSFKTGGVIDKIFVKEGDPIRTGQLLATLNLTEIDAGVTQARLALEKAQRDFERVKNLYADSVATLEQFQNAKTALDFSSTQYEAAQFNRSYSEIRAIGNGYVLKKMANPGQVIGPGSPVLQTNGARRGSWILKVGVSDRSWATLAVGDEARITTDASPDQKLTGVIARKSEGTDPYTGSFIIDIRLTDKAPIAVASGMFGKATLYPSGKQSVWGIPYDALLDADAKDGFVFVTLDGKTATKLPVTISSIGKNEVLVSGGLEEAQALIISGNAYLREGSAIEIIQ
jgi:RND family efflux transporter MFP subunit